MRILIPILALVVVFMGTWAFDAQGTVNQVTGNPILDNDVKLSKWVIAAATASERTSRVKTTDRKVARLQIMDGSQTAGGTWNVSGTATASFWLQGMLSNNTSEAAIRYATIPLVAATPTGATDIITTYGVHEFDIEGYSYVRVVVTGNSGLQWLYLNVVE